jgi:hypothetical protein
MFCRANTLRAASNLVHNHSFAARGMVICLRLRETVLVTPELAPITGIECSAASPQATCSR